MTLSSSIEMKHSSGQVLSEPAELQFYKIFRELQHTYGCTYMSYYESDTVKKEDIVGFFSDPDWGDIYTAEGMINNCALVRDGKSALEQNLNKNIVYPWDLAISQNAKERSVRDARKDFGIFHGFSLSIKQDNTFKFFGMATEENNKNFIRHILNDIDNLKKQVVYMRRLVQKSQKQA